MSDYVSFIASRGMDAKRESVATLAILNIGVKPGVDGIGDDDGHGYFGPRDEYPQSIPMPVRTSEGPTGKRHPEERLDGHR